MMSLKHLRRDILIFIRDHPGIGNMELIGSMCPTMQIAGFKTLRALVDDGLVKVEVIHNGPSILNDRSELTLTPEGMTEAEEIA